MCKNAYIPGLVSILGGEITGNGVSVNEDTFTKRQKIGRSSSFDESTATTAGIMIYVKTYLTRNLLFSFICIYFL